MRPGNPFRLTSIRIAICTLRLCMLWWVSSQGCLFDKALQQARMASYYLWKVYRHHGCYEWCEENLEELLLQYFTILCCVFTSCLCRLTTANTQHTTKFHALVKVQGCDVMWSKTGSLLQEACTKIWAGVLARYGESRNQKADCTDKSHRVHAPNREIHWADH